MQQVKIFKGVDTEISDIEKQINRFLRKTGVTVLSITGNLAAQPGSANGPMNSFAGSDVMVIILFDYDENAAKS